MAKKAACRCKAAECEECPEWIFTFADLVMLMMGFFVILWVLKPNGNPKSGPVAADDAYIKAAAAIREAFGHIPDPQSNDPIDMQELMQKLDRMKNNGPGEKGKLRTEEKGAEGTDKEVTSIRMGKQSSVGGRLLFERGSFAVPPEMNLSLDEIALQIRGHRNVVMIKGHTSKDDLADSATAQQKLDLSLRRAQAVADYLTRAGVSPESLRVQGCSTFEPVIQRAYTSEAQSTNRRVEVEALATLVGELQDKPAPANRASEKPAASANPEDGGK